MSVVTFRILDGAEGETRTPTPLRELDPEPSVSTNSTTSARRCVYANRGWLASIFFDFGKKKFIAASTIGLSFFQSWLLGPIYWLATEGACKCRFCLHQGLPVVAAVQPPWRGASGNLFYQ